MRKTQRRYVFVFKRKTRQILNDAHKLVLNELKRIVHHNQISVVAYEAACRAKMNDWTRFGTLDAIGVHMCHYIVSHDLFLSLSHIVVDVIHMLFKLGDLFIGDIKPHGFLAFSERHPKPSPGFKFIIVRENLSHIP